MEYYSLEKLPCPQTKEYIKNIQKICELFYSINNTNYLDVLAELTPLVTNTINSFTYLRSYCVICTEHNPFYSYYFNYVYSQIFLLLQNNIFTISYAYYSSVCPVHAFFAVFGIQDKNQFKNYLISSIFNENIDFNMFIIITILFSHSEIISLLSDLLKKTDLVNETKVNQFVNFVTYYYDDIRKIIKNEPVEKREDNENDIFLIIYEDNIDAFIQYLNEKMNNPLIQNPFLFQDSKYEFLSYYYHFLENSELIYVATVLHANKIIKYLLEQQPASRQMFDSLVLAIMRSDFDLIKLFSNYIVFPQFTFPSSLLQPNPDIINYVYEKSHFRFFNNFTVNIDIFHFPYSCIFLLNYMNSIRILPYPPHLISSLGIIYKNINPLNLSASHLCYFFQNFPYSLEVFEYVLNQTHKSFWTEYYQFFQNKNIVLDIINNAIKNYPIKMIKKVNDRYFPFSPTFKTILRTNDIKPSFFDIKMKNGLPLAFNIALLGDTQLFDLMIEKGYDVNNSKHPENASLIHFACISDRIDNLRHLLAVPGLDVNRKDGYGRTALDIARDPSYRALLINAGCKSSKTSFSTYNERDFTNSNAILHHFSIKGPPSFILTQGRECYSHVYNSISTSLVCCDNIIYLTYNIDDRGPYEIGTKSKSITQGPYNFGIIPNGLLEQPLSDRTVTFQRNPLFTTSK